MADGSELEPSRQGRLSRSLPGRVPLPERRHRALALLALLSAAALLGFAGCRDHGDPIGGAATADHGPLGGGAGPTGAPRGDSAGDADRLPAGPARPSPDQPGDVLGLGRAIHVAAGAPAGGLGTAEAPLASIQAALELARPGDAIRVGPGRYRELLRSVRPGTQDRPIWLVGDGAQIVRPTTDDEDEGHDEDDPARPGRVVVIAHDFVVLDGFDVSGGDINVYVFRASNVRLLRNTIHDARGECVRIKYFSSHNEVAFNRVDRCGLEGFDVDEDSKNGEGVYIGTAPEQRKKKNPTSEPDRSDANHVHDNLVSSPAECVDVKEAARWNVIERNTCERGQDPDGAGFSSRGIGTVLIDNVSRDHVGAGIRLGGDKDSDGVRSVVRGNQLVNNRGYGLKVQSEPQQALCGNVVAGNGAGPTNTEDVDPAAPCPP